MSGGIVIAWLNLQSLYKLVHNYIMSTSTSSIDRRGLVSIADVAVDMHPECDLEVETDRMKIVGYIHDVLQSLVGKDVAIRYLDKIIIARGVKVIGDVRKGVSFLCTFVIDDDRTIKQLIDPENILTKAN